ncbi:hypothetical protein PBV87_21780 [Niameybacter massiliensis]|uniref:Uncharacterized protein n=1 Tax=Holtiella tumoricola TaxID=3018743 RepID=A0AA42DVR7_9FIRM|nr:hypothetical protein [Holtiella tumoricola]MDA3734109.1 hypothetical protein [Holtiella tumoricola]
MSTDNDFLLNQLVKLGDMMGDGLHHEPDGKWIEKEYRKVAEQLGIIKQKPKSNDGIDMYMAERCNAVKCECGGALKQSRKGSFVAKCECGLKYRLGKRKPNK